MGFLTDEVSETNKIYTEIQFALSDIRNWISEDKLNERRYVRFFSVLEEYKKLVEEEKSKFDKKNIILKIFGSNEEIEKIENYKRENANALKEINNCTKCTCFKCSLECKMKSCNQCQEGVGCRISLCKNQISEPYSVYVYENKVIELYNEEYRQNMDYKILGMVYDQKYDIFYIIVERVKGKTGEDRKILSYRPENSIEDRYKSIEDEDDMNFAIDVFEEAYKK